MGGDGSKPLNSSCLHGANVIYLFFGGSQQYYQGREGKGDPQKLSRSRFFPILLLFRDKPIFRTAVDAACRKTFGSRAEKATSILVRSFVMKGYFPFLETIVSYI